MNCERLVSKNHMVWGKFETLKMKSLFNSCFVPNQVLLGKNVRNYWQYSSKYSQTIPNFVLKIYYEPIFKSLIFQLLYSAKILLDLQFSINGSIFGAVPSNGKCSILY